MPAPTYSRNRLTSLAVVLAGALAIAVTNAFLLWAFTNASEAIEQAGHHLAHKSPVAILPNGPIFPWRSRPSSATSRSSSTAGPFSPSPTPASRTATGVPASSPGTKSTPASSLIEQGPTNPVGPRRRALLAVRLHHPRPDL
ncbi:MAG TPA: hypothetical protein VF171_00775 [Trueperaceae bacterium]